MQNPWKTSIDSPSNWAIGEEDWELLLFFLHHHRRQSPDDIRSHYHALREIHGSLRSSYVSDNGQVILVQKMSQYLGNVASIRRGGKLTIFPRPANVKIKTRVTRVLSICWKSSN